MPQKIKLTNEWTKINGNRLTVFNLSYNDYAFIISSENKPTSDLIGVHIEPRKYHSAYVTSDTEFIWCRANVNTDVSIETANFV